MKWKKCSRLPVVNSFKVAVLVTAGLALNQWVATASTITSYSLTLTGTSGPKISGTGILTLSTPVPLTGSFSTTEGGTPDMYDTDLLGLTFKMSDGNTFSLSHENGSSSAFFSNDVLQNLSFNYNSSLPSLGIGGTSYNYTTSYQTAGTQGTITFNPIPLVAAPEPTSTLLILPALTLFAPWRVRKGLLRSCARFSA